MARIIIAASAGADSAAILAELNSKAGQPTVIKYRTLFKALYDRFTPTAAPPALS